jgi:hypothetical protein
MDDSSLQPHQPPERWQFSLGMLLFWITALSIPLGILQGLRLPPEMRNALLVLTGALFVGLLIAVGPRWLRYRRLQRDMARKKGELARWVQERRAGAAPPGEIAPLGDARDAPAD